MVQVVGRQHIDFGHTKVMMDILIFGVDDDVRMFYRVFAGFVDPWAQRRHVGVMDLFIRFYGVVKFDGVGSSTEEGISGLQGVNYLEGGEKLLQVLIVFDFIVPLTFPHFFDGVSLVLELSEFFLGTFVHFLQGTVRVYDGKSVTLFRKTFRAPVP